MPIGTNFLPLLLSFPQNTLLFYLATHISGFSFYLFDMPTCFQLNVDYSDVGLTSLESLDHSCLQNAYSVVYMYLSIIYSWGSI